MRALVGAACLVGSATILQGCGSGSAGGSGSGSGCAAKGLPIVTQSATTTTEITGTVTTKGAPLGIGKDGIPVTGTINGDFKINVEKKTLSVQQKASLKAKTTIKVLGIGVPVEASAVATARSVFDSSQTLVTYYEYKVTLPTIPGVDLPTVAPGKACNVCKQAVSPEVLAKEWAKYKPQVQEQFTCAGSDTWRLAKSVKKGGEFPPPIPGGDTSPVDGDVDVDVKMDKTPLVKSLTTKTTVAGDDVADGYGGSVELSTTTAFTDSSATGPTPEDLDYTQWPSTDECVEECPSSFDIRTFFDQQFVFQQEVLNKAITAMASGMQELQAKQMSKETAKEIVV